MIKRYIIAVVILLAIVITTVSVVSAKRMHWKLFMAESQQDVVDDDFLATISRTQKPYVYHIKVWKRNPKARKQISPRPIQVDFKLENKDGVVISGHPGGGVLAQELTETLSGIGYKSSTSREGDVRLLTRYIAPGKYLLDPVVRIVEIGKDAMNGPYSDGGSVAIPSGERIWINIPETNK